MEAIIRTDNKTLFESLLLFLKTLNITVEKTEPVKSKKISKKIKNISSLNKFQQLLLNGPVMSDDDYHYFQGKKHNFNKWK